MTILLYVFIVVIIIMYVGDEQSVLRDVTVVAPRPPPRRSQPHPSVQRECTYVCLSFNSESVFN